MLLYCNQVHEEEVLGVQALQQRLQFGLGALLDLVHAVPFCYIEGSPKLAQRLLSVAMPLPSCIAQLTRPGGAFVIAYLSCVIPYRRRVLLNTVSNSGTRIRDPA